MEGGADLFDVGSVDADGFVELFAGDVELVGPVGDVGCHFGIDLFGVVRALSGLVLMEGVDRDAIHAQVAAEAVKFFDRALRMR